MAAVPGGISREALERLVAEGLSIREIAVRLDRSPATVKYWLRRYELRTQRMGRRELRGKYALSRCGKHGVVRFVLERSGYYRCVRCRSEQVARRRRRVKAILVEEHGGRCVRCGYRRFMGALAFHHRDPAAKSFEIAGRGLTRGIATVRAEAAKCDLLCANCHAEVEGGLGPALP